MSRHYAFAYAQLAGIVLSAGLLAPTLLVPSEQRGALGLTDVLIPVGIAAVVLPPLFIWFRRKMGHPIGRAVHCPRCSTELPYFRWPSSLRQAFRGGWDCRSCGASLDGRGRERGTQIRHG